MFKNLDLISVAQSLAKREFSVLELLEEQLKATDSAHRYNCVVATNDRHELKVRAIEAQRCINNGEGGLLQGIPISVKDVLAVADMPITGGSLLLKENVATKSAPIVTVLTNAGAQVVAKTNCPEFAFGITTSNLLFGTTLSPYGPELSPGGSSGGEAVAVATGVSLLGIGTDFGGSLRWPAQCLGLVALRPTPGVLSPKGQIPGVGPNPFDGESLYDTSSLQYKLQVPGFLARSVGDLRAVFEIATGKASIDSFSAGPSKVGSDNKNISVEQELQGCSISWSDGRKIAPVDDEIALALEAIVNELNKMGFVVTVDNDRLIGAREAFDDLRSYDELTTIRDLGIDHFDLLSPAIQRIISSPVKQRDKFESALETGRSIVNNAADHFEHHPLLLLPVAGAVAVGHDESATVDGELVSGFNLMAHCRAVSMLGFPVVTVPIARSRLGLPIALQIVAPPNREDLALELGGVIESIAGGWSHFTI